MAALIGRNRSRDELELAVFSDLVVTDMNYSWV